MIGFLAHSERGFNDLFCLHFETLQVAASILVSVRKVSFLERVMPNDRVASVPEPTERTRSGTRGSDSLRAGLPGASLAFRFGQGSRHPYTTTRLRR